MTTGDARDGKALLPSCRAAGFAAGPLAVALEARACFALAPARYWGAFHRNNVRCPQFVRDLEDLLHIVRPREDHTPVILVRPATPEDIDGIASLTEEMDRFYGAAEFDPLEQRRRQIADALFGESPAAYALLAFDEAAPAGFASYSSLWPAIALTRSLYLKELYVSELRQRSGVGRQLMASLFKVAKKHRCSRVEWTTDRSNTGAQTFYRELGVEQLPSKLFYRVEAKET